ncbi:MAG: sensor histidine kinase [Synechococcaceae bacterium WB9_2_112]|nr:sensor histidine kinase [Synechococcaceae bacterium WB9_2_112]
MTMPWRQNSIPRGHPAKPLQRQQLELLGLYLLSLAGILLVFAAVVRKGFESIVLADLRSQLVLIGEDFSSLPMPAPGSERDLQASHKDFTTAHQQVEWFLGNDWRPAARLGEVRTLGRLPPRRPTQRMVWQSTSDTLALIRPADADGLDSRGRPRVWLRISQGLDSVDRRLQQLDLAMTVAIVLALMLSAASATLLARRVVEPLQRSLRRLREFELDASHELRGPLAAMSANAEMGLLDCRSSDDPQRQRFAAIASATDQMQKLVNDLLLLARQEEGSIDQAQRLDLAALVQEQLNLYGDALALRQQHLQSNLQHGLSIMGQASLLQQVVRNLLDNAHRYSPDGGTISVSLERRGNKACLDIGDEGPGIPADQLQRVFDRFWRASADRGDGGSGLGLAIVARIIRVHGGSISVASRPGCGSRFSVSLPLMANG